MADDFAITDELMPLAKQVLEKWIENYKCNDPSDRPRAEGGVLKAYEKAGRPLPTKFSWFLSPKAAVEYIAETRVAPKLTEDASIYDKDRPDPANPGKFRLKRSVVEDIFGRVCFGNEDVVWLAAYDFYNQIGKFDKSEVQCVFDIGESTHIWWACKGEAVMVDRQRNVQIDNIGRAHCLTGPAFSFGDGHKIYVIENIRVPEKVVMAPETITVEDIRALGNQIELRRIYQQQMGMRRYLEQCGAQIVEMDGGVSRFKDGAPVNTGSAPRVLMRDMFNDQYMVCTDGSTKRVYTISVSPNAKTPQEAHESVSGLPEAAMALEC